MGQFFQTFSQLKMTAFKILTVLGFIHIREQIFSNINFIRKKLISPLNDISHGDICSKSKTTNYTLDLNKLCSEIQCRKSHLIHF